MNLDNVDVVKDGAALRYHPDFAPKGTNANFVQVLAPDSVAIRTYERGVEGETSGVRNGRMRGRVAAASSRRLSVARKRQVRGGDTLRVAFERSGDGFHHVTLTGPADFVFEGTISL